MTDPNPRAVIGANNPPDPIDEALAPYADLIDEVSQWTDGEPVSNDAAMASVDKLIAEMKSARAAVEKARKLTTDPLNAAFRAEVARWKPTTEDLDRQQACLVALVGPYKASKLREQEEARQKAWKAARDAEDAAREAAAKAQSGNLEDARAAAAADEAFKAAEADKQAAIKSKTKGLRTVQHYEITDQRAHLRWMYGNPAGLATLHAAADDFARKNAGKIDMDGVRAWTTKEAF